jgi:hypothetical protein
MRKTRRYYESDDEDETLQDGRKMRVPMRFADAASGDNDTRRRKMRADPDEDADEDPDEQEETEGENENATADSARGSVRIVDAYGSGDPLAMRRPGPRYIGSVARAVDAEYLHEVRIERRTAMRDHESFLNNSWRGNQQRDDWGQMEVGDPCTCKSSDDEGEFGSDGTLQMRAGKGLVCVSTRRDSRSVRDTIEQARRDYVRDLTTAWQHPTRARDADFHADLDDPAAELADALRQLGYDRGDIAAFVKGCTADDFAQGLDALIRRFEASAAMAPTKYNGNQGSGGTGDRQSIADAIRDHQARMQRLYDARDRELENAWRVGK